MSTVIFIINILIVFFFYMIIRTAHGIYTYKYGINENKKMIHLFIYILIFSLLFAISATDYMLK